MVNKGLIPILFNNPIPQEYKDYAAYVTQQGGTIQNTKNALDWIKLLKSMGVYNNTRVLWSGGMGVTIDPNTPGDTISKAFSADVNRNNLVQATKAIQPLRVGQVQQIAEGLYNGNGGSRFMAHPPISFGASDPWSVCMMLNFNGNAGINTIPIGDTTNARYIYVRLSNNNRVYVKANGDYFFAAGITNQIIGKNTVIHIVADGSNGLVVYINGTAYNTTGVGTDTRFTFSRDNVQDYFGSHLARRIQSGALTAAQVAAEAALLSAQWPAIPSVTIGTQIWAVRNFDAVCTPMGNVIPEVTDNAAWGALTTPAWRHYNNDSANGAVYGKMYNWYALKLISDDIATYNAANPTNRFGYHLATQAELNTLVTYLGGASVAGGKLKSTGLTHWLSPNTGATNESGFFGLPGGFTISGTGAFANLGQNFQTFAIDQISATHGQVYSLSNDNNQVSTGSVTKDRGVSLRLIKD